MLRTLLLFLFSILFASPALADDLADGLAAHGRDDHAAAYAAFARACDAGVAKGCHNQAAIVGMGFGAYDALSHGEDGPALDKKERLRRLYGKACAGGVAMGCYKLAVVEGNSDRPAESRAAYRKACSAEVPWSCWHAGREFERKGPLGADPASARAMYQTGCDNGDAYSCVKLRGDKPPPGYKAMPAGATIDDYRKACDAGYGDLCGEAAWKLIDRNMANAFRPDVVALYRKACLLGASRCSGYENGPIP